MPTNTFNSISNESNDQVSVDTNEKNVRVHLFVSGKVQGVYFRKYTTETAIQNNVFGWVKNLGDGRVECIAEGKVFQINNLINWCRIGPPNAIVDVVDINYEPYVGEFNDFSITG